MHTRQKRLNAPTHEKILKYWIGRTPPGCAAPLDIYDLCDMACFACGWWHLDPGCPDGCPHVLERAHVVPHARGGDDQDPANFALLCKGCHRAAPDTVNAEWFWRWVAERPRRTPLLAALQLAADAFDTAAPSVAPHELDALAAASPETLEQAARIAVDRLQPLAPFSVGTYAGLIVEAARLCAAPERP
jgi:hypothetical protein